jgi:hypothetical protein
MDQLSYLVQLIEEQNAMIGDLQAQVAHLTDLVLDISDDE